MLLPFGAKAKREFRFSVSYTQKWGIEKFSRCKTIANPEELIDKDVKQQQERKHNNRKHIHLSPLN